MGHPAPGNRPPSTRCEAAWKQRPCAGRAIDAQVVFETLMVGNFDEKSLALRATLTATWRATDR